VKSKPTAEVAALLKQLDEVLRETPNGRGSVLAEDAAMQRKVTALKVQFQALRALEFAERTEQQSLSQHADILNIRCAELSIATLSLLMEALGYYALPVPEKRPGDNEKPVGGDYAQPTVAGMLACLTEYTDRVDALKNRLAGKLLE